MILPSILLPLSRSTTRIYHQNIPLKYLTRNTEPKLPRMSFKKSLQQRTFPTSTRSTNHNRPHSPFVFLPYLFRKILLPLRLFTWLCITLPFPYLSLPFHFFQNPFPCFPGLLPMR